MTNLLEIIIEGQEIPEDKQDLEMVIDMLFYYSNLDYLDVSKNKIIDYIITCEQEYLKRYGTYYTY